MKRARQVSANPLWRRLQHAWQRLRGQERYKSNVVSFLDVAGQRYKQVRFPSVSEARRVEAILRATEHCGVFPTLIHRLESTLWVRFVRGGELDPGQPEHREALYRFFATLYAQQAKQVDLSATGLPDRLRVHLETLGEVGVLDEGRRGRLLALAERLAPPQVSIGLEYIDSLRKNFILAPTGLVGIDIEAAWEQQLLGIGLAKTRLRWLDAEAAPILDRLIELGGPDLRAQYPYAHLVFLAQYSVQSLLRGKPERVPPSAFDTLLAAHDS